jgi:DNA-binding NarL/FixJ family response regulator
MTLESLTPEERQIIELIAEGMARWGIAARLDLSQDRVRLVIRRLCERFDCPMVDLPAAVGLSTIADEEPE